MTIEELLKVKNKGCKVVYRELGNKEYGAGITEDLMQAKIIDIDSYFSGKLYVTYIREENSICY